ncbi:acyl-CoA dehydrogenase C-terminal domain-containing protein [Zhongshania sp. BJYM1]|uniref:acyl-CoA dehydrogenase C-terminal domain-containing protein n=1 Tax=Zhongshania aquatica TaxID=2965069 RepID=UPI0022B5C931|nr:acyl-CoA dehydrogenase C-terminal domain-containing protein [Marortus sp. BJYM1]
MSNYTAPIRDVFFSMEEVNDFVAHYQYLLSDTDYDFDDVKAALPEIGRFASDILAPLNSIGDAEGVRCERGEVRSPSGFSEAYRQYVEGGWPTLAQSEEFGGMPLPFSAKIAAGEFLQSANQSWCMYTALNDGAIKCLVNFATPNLITRYVPKLVSGEWLATMCLTEAQCGSDLNLLTSKAEPTASGSYRISGTKIFISSGEHDFTDNIVHLVLARLPDAPAGTRGISLFLVPKRLVNEDSSLGELNNVSCLSTEHKMGLKGSATCVMAFDGAEGWLVGAPNRGLQNMFVFINKSRLGVGQQAQGQIEAAFQTSLIYSHERRAGRAPGGAVSPESGADALIHQPDICRMLMSQKAIAEGGRALIHWCAKYVDISDLGNAAEQGEAEQLLGLLIPITKGCLSELASEMTDYGVQILGGHGYVTEWGLEQRVRDVRVTRIYEGTTGIQGIDLLARKITGRGRPAFQKLIDIMLSVCSDDASEKVKPLQRQLTQAIAQWRELTDDLEIKAEHDSTLLSAIAVDYLMIAGYISLGYMWLKAAVVADNTLVKAQTTEPDFYRAKLQTAQFYFDKILPRIELHTAVIGNGALNCDLALSLPA